MNWKAYTPLAVAVVLGLLAARVGMSLVRSGNPAAAEPTNLMSLVVAARDVEPGTTLTEADVMVAKVSPEAAPLGAFISPAQAANQVVKVALTRGQALTPNLLAEDGAGYGVGATLPPGYRAITVDISDTTGVAGFILPKCRVDVVATLSVDGKSMAKTVLEGISVLAVGSRTNPTTPNDPQAPQSKTVTLLVKPKDAEKLELAASTSRVRLVLRNGRDETLSESEGITLAELKGDRSRDPFADDVLQVSATQPSSVLPVSHRTPATRPANTTWTVQVIKAGQMTQQNFDVPVAPMPQAVQAEMPAADDELITSVEAEANAH